jgi:cell division transport system ATP-binding protein
MIQLYHVHKKYGETPALFNINLKVERGEFIFLTGPSGAGKTTFLKLLYRELFPSSGQIIVNGRNVAVIPDSKIPYLRREMGIVFQDFKLLNNKTIFDNIAFVPRILGVGKRKRRKMAYDVLRKLSIQDKMHYYPLQLSGGEQQRVAIARALINEPILLLADEPTGNLDPDLSMEIMKIFSDINKKGTTVIVATHDRDMIRRIGRRVIALDRGKLVDYY